MENLLNRIEKEIEKEALKTGRMGTENVSIKIELTETEKEEFHKIKFSKNYWWEFEENLLYISYTEKKGEC